MPPVILNQETHQRIAAFARVTGKTVSAATDEAINEWMDCHGEPIMKGMERLRKKKETCRLLVFRAERKIK